MDENCMAHYHHYAMSHKQQVWTQNSYPFSHSCGSMLRSSFCFCSQKQCLTVHTGWYCGPLLSQSSATPPVLPLLVCVEQQSSGQGACHAEVA